ncbi:MAG: siroheme synthase CysG [Pseudomonadota bacterium]
MDYLPIFMDLKGRHAVVVGGGTIASRKAELIAKSGVSMTIVADRIAPAMEAAIDRLGFKWLEKKFEPSDVETAHIVVAATDDEQVNAHVQRAASARRIPVNVVDAPELCSFIMPAIVDRSPVMIAISTGGKSPVLARHVRSFLERTLPSQLGRLGTLFGKFRARVAERMASFAERRNFWEMVMDSAIPDLVYAGRDDEATERLNETLSNEQWRLPKCGRVHLIGAGPGDAELFTIKGQRLLQKADVVVYDRLVPVGVLEMCRREAETIYVGKRSGDHPLPQEQISALLIRLARQGKCVVRLKGGDPFTFGRGGEELAELLEAGIDAQVVPGVSSANGAAAYAGIPLTHRDHAHSVSYWTGHLKAETLDQLDWRGMATGRQTLVFFMARPNASRIADHLLENGLSAVTPTAIVMAATTPRQQVIRTTLKAMPERMDQTDRELPALLIIGSVVGLRSRLEWYDGGSDQSEIVFPRHCSVPAAERATA